MSRSDSRADLDPLEILVIFFPPLLDFISIISIRLGQLLSLSLSPRLFLSAREGKIKALSSCGGMPVEPDERRMDRGVHVCTRE